MKWQVDAYRIGGTAKHLDTTWVDAESQGLAECIGRVVFARRHRGRFFVAASQYYPEHDPAFRGGVVRIREVVE